MKTDRLIEMLARDAGPAPRGLVARRLAPVAAIGLPAGAALALGAFGAIPAHQFAGAVPWIKLAYAGALACAAAWLAARLSRPGASAGAAWRAMAAVVLAMAVVACAWVASRPDGMRVEALLGRSWTRCPSGVLGLSVPALAIALWAMRGLAPTRPVVAGFAAGLFAGAIGACAYALACDEASPAFVAAWYTLGVLASGALGAALGSRVLRW
jgi:hypothetical protein